MATATPPVVDAGGGDQCVVLRGIGWDGYKAVLRARGESGRPKLIYLDGDLYLMSPAFAHEFLGRRLGQLVTEVVVGLDIPCIPARETTFRRRKKKGGAEADESFYLKNLAPILAKPGKDHIHLRRDPHPDLVIEAVNTREADEAVEVWQRFGVPEVWVCDAERLRILVLQPDGAYSASTDSLKFPFLTAAEIFGWVSKPVDASETSWTKDVRRWVVETLVPRVRASGGAAGEGA